MVPALEEIELLARRNCERELVSKSQRTFVRDILWPIVAAQHREGRPVKVFRNTMQVLRKYFL
jgi:hypothetical protein